MALAAHHRTGGTSFRRHWIRPLILCVLPLCGRGWVLLRSGSAPHQPTWSNRLTHERAFRGSRWATRLLDSASSSPLDEGQMLLDQARQLRKEISELERSRKAASLNTNGDVVDTGSNEPDTEKVVQKTLKHGYDAVVPVLLGDGTVEEEEVEFVPFHKDGLSRILTVEAPLPLGIVLGESEEYSGAISVDEVAVGGNGDQVGIKEGDLVRAFTACRMQMDQPSWQLMAGGIGIPKHFRFMYSADKRPFEEVMEAIGSNRMDPQGRPVLLVLERLDDA